MVMLVRFPQFIIGTLPAVQGYLRAKRRFITTNLLRHHLLPRDVKYCADKSIATVRIIADTWAQFLAIAYLEMAYAPIPQGVYGVTCVDAGWSLRPSYCFWQASPLSFGRVAFTAIGRIGYSTPRKI